jgi:hypothetical protein
MKLSIKAAIALLFPAVALLVLTPGVNAQTTLNQQLRSARILSTGAIEPSSTSTSWLTVSHTAGSAIYDLTFTPAFTAKPNCLVVADSVAGNGDRFAEVHASQDASQGLNTLEIFTSYQIPNSGGIIGSIDASFTIRCAPDTNVALSAASWNAAGTLTSGSDWIAGISAAGNGTYTLTFSKPYLSTPNCVATPIAIGNITTASLVPTTTGVTVYITTFNSSLGLVTLVGLPNPGTIHCSGPQ